MCFTYKTYLISCQAILWERQKAVGRIQKSSSFDIRIFDTLNSQASCKLTDTTNFLTSSTGLTQMFSVQWKLILCYFVCTWYSCFIWQTRSVQPSGLNFFNLEVVFFVKSGKAVLRTFMWLSMKCRATAWYHLGVTSFQTPLWVVTDEAKS